MILIITDEDDIHTIQVQRWLNFYSAEYFKVTEDSDIKISKFFISNVQTDIEFIISNKFYNNKILNISEITAVWYRRGSFEIKTDIFSNPKLSANLSLRMNSYLKSELKFINDEITRIFKSIKSINSDFDNNINKTTALQIAKFNGLDIPRTVVTSSLSELKNYTTTGSYITKSINSNFFTTKEYLVSGGTWDITDFDFLALEGEKLFPSLIQEKLAKKYELRIFYLENDFYASAIFSQSNEKTKVDFRNYDFERPNQVVPYNLPEEIKEKLIRTMKALQINCGSIDMVVTDNNKFVFLEVNPIGQFAQVSYPCNYYLDRLIARKLIEYEKDNRRE